MMMEKESVHSVPDLGPNGFLRTMSDWNRAEAQRLAIEHGVGDLTDDHWKVIEFVQHYYREYGLGPPVVKVHNQTGLSSADICRLFPCGMVKGAYRLSGLPRPPGCS
jgi:tRNA 2-thiouridine synthesizing protein E